jgi:hypothetical protein
MYLFKSCKVTLIKSIIFNLPTYFMSLFPLPIGVANCIEKLHRDFLGCGLGEEFKFHLISWSKVCPLISKGGLGVWNLQMFNRALLGKWLWCYVRERDAWWIVVVDSKFGSLWGGWCSKEPPKPYGVRLWKNIRRGWKMFSSHTRFEMGPRLDSSMMCGLGRSP